MVAMLASTRPTTGRGSTRSVACSWKLRTYSSVVVALLLRLIFAIKTFDIIFIMTKGGPGTATDLISYFIYRAAFFGLDIGRASAMSVGLLVIVLALTTYLYRYMRSLR